MLELKSVNKQELHKARLQKLDISDAYSKLRAKYNTLKKDNAKLSVEVTKLNTEAEKDCKLVLSQVKELELADAAEKRRKKQVNSLKKRLEKVERLFCETLSLKLYYEEVMVKLTANTVTKTITEYLLASVPQQNMTLEEISQFKKTPS